VPYTPDAASMPAANTAPYKTCFKEASLTICDRGSCGGRPSGSSVECQKHGCIDILAGDRRRIFMPKAGGSSRSSCYLQNSRRHRRREIFWLLCAADLHHHCWSATPFAHSQILLLHLKLAHLLVNRLFSSAVSVARACCECVLIQCCSVASSSPKSRATSFTGRFLVHLRLHVPL
jgi:hypothetical protein